MKILYDDAFLTVAIKPVGISSQASEDHRDMLTLLRAEYEKQGEHATPYVLHRLDTAVSGVMVYAKTASSAAFLSREIAEGRLQKDYYAVVSGDAEAVLGASEGELHDLMFKDSRKNKSFTVDRMRKGVKKASLSYRVVDTFTREGEVRSLIAIRLITGRTHQIRVQFSSRRLPLVGDGKYGSRVKGALQLFSCGIAFTHPDTKQRMQFSVALPEGWCDGQKE